MGDLARCGGLSPRGWSTRLRLKMEHLAAAGALGFVDGRGAFFEVSAAAGEAARFKAELLPGSLGDHECGEGMVEDADNELVSGEGLEDSRVVWSWGGWYGAWGRREGSGEGLGDSRRAQGKVGEPGQHPST